MNDLNYPRAGPGEEKVVPPTHKRKVSADSVKFKGLWKYKNSPDKNIEENIHTPKGAQSWLSLSSGHEMLIDHWGEMKPSRWRNRMECAECCRVALHILQHFAAFSTCN